MTGVFEAWMFGYAGTKIADKILNTFKSHQLTNDLLSAIDRWTKELPSDISLASSHALFPNDFSYEEVADRKSLNMLRLKLNNSTIPEQEDWANALLEQWNFVRSNISNPQEFFLIEEQEALKHITKLSRFLDIVCAKHKDLFKVTTINLLRDIAKAGTTGIEAEDIKHVIGNIMHDIRSRTLTLAEEKLDILMSIESLDANVRNILTALSIKIGLTKATIPTDKQLLINLYKNQTTPIEIRDIASSILLDLEARTQPEIARQRYSDLTQKTPYIEEAFFEFLATTYEIEQKLEASRKYDLSEQELTGLTRGAFRNQDFELAVSIGKFLNESYPSTNGKTLLLYGESCLIATNNQSKHYLLLDREVKNDVDRLINQLINSIHDKDVRHISTLMNLLNITHFSDRRLIELGTKYSSDICKFDIDFPSKLHELTSSKPIQNSPYELPEVILDLKSYSGLDAAIRNKSVSNFAISKWLNDGGRVRTEDKYFDSFLELNLKAKICDRKNKKLINEIKELAERFLDSNAKRLDELHPIAVMELSENFLDLDLPLCAVNFLSALLPSSPWLSPILNCYLNALLASEKYEQLKNQLDKIVFEEKSSSVWLIETQLYQRLKHYDLAIAAVENAISLNPDNAYSWFFLLQLSRMKGTSVECLKKIVLNDIPSMIFETYGHSKLLLVNEISTYIDPYIAERILVDWFVQNPEELAIPLTQLHFNSLLNRAENSNNPYLPNHCGDGVLYSDGLTTRKKLLVRNINSNHSDLLDAESPLGQAIEKMQVGETAESSRGKIKLIDRLPSYVAAFRLAIELREKKNDGTDSFHLLTMPTDEEEFIPYLENMLKHFSSEDRNQNDVLQNPNIPLVMRGYYTNPTEPLKGAIVHLTTQKSTKHLHLFDKGIDKPSKVIIDVYTAVYCALIGVASTL